VPRVLVFDIDPASLFYQYYSEDADVKSSIHLTSSGSTCSCRCQVGSVVSVSAWKRLYHKIFKQQACSRFNF